jgi:hypothetical protein
MRKAWIRADSAKQGPTGSGFEAFADEAEAAVAG